MQHFKQLNKANQFASWLGLRSFASVYNYRDATNPQVFMTVSRDGQPLGKMVFEVSSLGGSYFFVALQEPQP